MKKNGQKITIMFYLIISLFLPYFFLPAGVFAQTLNTTPTSNINEPGFRLVVCDGPDLSGIKTPIQMIWHGESIKVPPVPDDYVACNFNGLMKQVQHLINIMLVLGVVAAIAGFLYAGYIYISAGISGDSNAHGKAKDIFWKLGKGFIIMLSAWFIVYQILVWLTGQNSGFGFLLGK